MNRHAMTYLDNRLAPLARGLARLTLPLALGLGLGMSLAACQQQGQQAERPPLEGASIGGPFTLEDKNGKTVTWDQFKGKWRIVYFGYTFCPDACPLDVQAMMRGFNQFAGERPDLAAKVQPIFISIDPERDTPKVVGEWTAAFGPRLLGLTGTPEQVKQAADAFAAYYKRGDDTPGGYLMDHSRVAYLMDPDGKPIAMLLPVDHGPPAPAVAAELAKWVK
ncbi:SCO family protein [Novosphingobium mangrovi (ex Huang et al. 2023)]|uniref:SCO family protein n=1 Tax=Novosphingobium mangrovi (ex Huang et al. 2023) TaxID=2976432 RepID=A0ABT2I248_9SPHN|nr:SCO family protein [Novosphingobium mangrovi (ex Huang et al. 2023)]MCT2398682.1 SCO family protein [Novosphingobium mangrovi (ex Huang et al. 2023)]